MTMPATVGIGAISTPCSGGQRAAVTAAIQGRKEQAYAPFFVDADAVPENPGGWPKGGTRLDLPNRHLEYVVTWYGLALTLIGVFAAFARSACRAV